MRAVGSTSLQNSSRSENRSVRIHRRILQSASLALVARLSITGQLREEVRSTTRATLRALTVHGNASSPREHPPQSSVTHSTSSTIQANPSVYMHPVHLFQLR